MFATKYQVSVLSLLLLRLAIISTEVIQFRPITDGINFRANYRVQTFVDGRPVSTSDVYESYHFTLATGLIRHTILDEDQAGRGSFTKDTFKYLYDSRAKRLVEFSRDRGDENVELGDVLFHDDICLPENGCTNSYQSYTYSKQAVDEQQSRCNEQLNSVRVLPQALRLDSKLLLAGTGSNWDSLNLDKYMTSDCLARIESNLHYIQGVSRLLHLIECRRGEFHLGQKVAGLTRSMASREYRATRLRPTDLNESADIIGDLDVSIAIEEIDRVGKFGRDLDAGAIPLSISVSFAPNVTILINVFQFEAIGPDEHLSESSSSYSIYMMPLAHPGLDVALGSIQRSELDTSDVFYQKVGKSFSFRGSLMGNSLSKFYSDPIEISMSFDADLKSLASETSFIDRSNSDGLDGWRRSIVGQLLDGQSSLKFHLMERNFGYRHLSSASDHERSGQLEESNWRPCATNHLSSSESKLLLDERSDLLNLEGAIYMGMALVRGIQCHVFERRLFKLPVWLNLDTRSFDLFLESKEIYLNAFVYYNQMEEPILTRLHLRALRQGREPLSWVLDLNSFSWSAEEFIGDGSLSQRTLVERMTQQCLLLDPGARHLGLEFWFKPSGPGKAPGSSAARSLASQSESEAKLRRELQASAELRNQALVEMLAKSLKISPVQQVDFHSEISSPDGGENRQENNGASDGSSGSGSNWLLYVKFNLYELWNDLVEEEIIGFALDKSFNTRLPSKAGPLYAQGARSHSYEECKWRAIHSLRRSSVTSEYNRRDMNGEAEFSDNNLRLFMFCPERLICHLGDSSWLLLRSKRALTLENLLEFPYATNDNSTGQFSHLNRCLLSSVIIRQQSILSKSSGLQSCRSKLEWWLESGRHSSSERPEPDDESDHDDDALARLRLRELKYELKVRRTTTSASPNRLPPAGDKLAADQQQQQQQWRWQALEGLRMEASKLRLSNRVLVSNPNSGGGADEQLATSALTKPLAGLAYRSYTLEPDGHDKPTADDAARAGSNGNASHVGGLRTETQNIEPLVVLNLAECSRQCLLLHECRSFSACHQALSTWPLSDSSNDLGQRRASGGRISCIFSKISWSDPGQVNQLMRLARRSKQAASGATPGSAFMEVDVNELVAATAATAAAAPTNQRPRVQFELSPLCSLHARPQMNLFRLRRSHSEVQPRVDYLIYARSAEQCARFCQERAELMRQLELTHPADSWQNRPPGMSGASRWAACHEFYYSADNHYCKLAPMANHWRLLELEHLLSNKSRASGQQRAAANETDRSELIHRWRRWLQSGTPLGIWLKRIASVFGESEYYELDFRQIFLAHQNHRLTLVTGASAGELDTEAGQLQVQLSVQSRLMCAEFCLRRKGCRSFSLRLAGGQNSGRCLLNAVAARDLPAMARGQNSSALAAAAAAAAFKFERVAAASSATNSSESGRDVWWHYEPSELASFMMSDPDEWQPSETMAGLRRATTGGDDSDSLDLFVRPEPSLFYDGTRR